MTGYRILKSVDIIPVHNKFGSKNYDTDSETEYEHEYGNGKGHEHDNFSLSSNTLGMKKFVSSDTSNSQTPNEVQLLKLIPSPNKNRNDILNDMQKDFKSSYFNVNDNTNKISKVAENLRLTDLSFESPLKNTNTDATDLKKIDNFPIKKHHPEGVFNHNHQSNLQPGKMELAKQNGNNVTAHPVIFETPTNKPKTMFKNNLKNKSDENPFSNDFWNIKDTLKDDKFEKPDKRIEVNVKQNLAKPQKTYKRRLKQKKLPLKVENSRITRSKIKKNENQFEKQSKTGDLKKTQRFINDSVNKINKPVSNNVNGSTVKPTTSTQHPINEPKILVKGSPMNSQNVQKETKFEKSEISETVYSSQIFSSSQDGKDFTIQQAQTSNFLTTSPPPPPKNPVLPVVDNKVSKNEIIIENQNQSTPKRTAKPVSPPNEATTTAETTIRSKKDKDQDIFNTLKNLKHFITKDMKEISIDLSEPRNNQSEATDKNNKRDENNNNFDDLISFNDSNNYLHNSSNWMNHGPSYQDLIMQSINIMSNNVVNKMRQVEKRINEKQREIHFRIDEKFNQIHNLHKLQIDNFLHKTESLIQETIINEEKLSKEFKD
ncbi:hypothetical protein BVG19_g394 [[Candida] boidinii]|nr:hypothetical protein BVG19_g394 [[Candida] boidinii]OWB50187.1 hypothetical protein B5S27_g1735 [[Candida] boidinii]